MRLSNIPKKKIIKIVATSLAVIFSLLTVLFIAIYFYLSPLRVEKIIKEKFSQNVNGKIDLKILNFNPYGDIIIKDIKITGAGKFKDTEFLTLEKIVFKYGFFKILTGSVRFEEIGLYNPSIYLKQKGKIWNFERLFKKSKNKLISKQKTLSSDETIVNAEKEQDSKEINLPIAVDFYLKFVLKNLKVIVDGTDFYSSLKGFDFGFNVEIPPVKKIPKSINAISIIKTFKIDLNPKKLLNFKINSKNTKVGSPLILNWNLFLNNGNKKKFRSKFQFGAFDTPITLKNRYLGPLKFMISYDLKYDPLKDILDLKDFTISFMDNRWLSLNGVVKNIQKKPKLKLSILESKISLNSLYPYYKKILMNKKEKFGGFISLKPFSINGNLDSVDIFGNIRLDNIFYKSSDFSFNLPTGIILYKLKKQNNLYKIMNKINLQKFSYRLQRNRSRLNSLEVNTKVEIDEFFSNINIKQFSANLFESFTKKRALSLNVVAQMKKKKNINLNIKVKKLRFNLPIIKKLIPENLEEKLNMVKLTKPVDITMGINLNQSSSKSSIQSVIKIKIPDYNLRDFYITTSLSLNNFKKTINLKKLKIFSKEFGVNIKANGFVKQKVNPFSFANLDFLVDLNFPKNKQFIPDWNLNGALKFKTTFKGSLKNGKIHGSLFSENIDVKNEKLKFHLEKFNIDFPFEYKLNTWQKDKTIIFTSKKDILGIEGESRLPNFTIKSLSAKHPARNMKLQYLKDFSTYMNFSENIFFIENMKATVLDGTVLGKKILFNFADLKKENMEFKFVMDVTNIDIGKIDRVVAKGKKRDAELSMNINFQGRGLDPKKELNLTGYIGIHKIGDKFANRLFKGLNERQGESKLGVVQYAVDGFALPKQFNFKLDKGLMYTTVKLERKILSQLTGVKVKNDKINFDRIPIQEFLRKVKKGK